MNELRNQLQRARHTYAAAQYPGDLASEVLPAPRRSITRWAIVGSAIAAAIIVSLIVLDDAPEPFDVATVRLTSSSPREGVPISLELPPMPAMPTNIGLSVPKMPQIPSLDALLRSDETFSTTQEAV